MAMHKSEQERIHHVLGLLQRYWEKYPHLRLGQIVGNAAGSVLNPYYLPDEELILILEDWLEGE